MPGLVGDLGHHQRDIYVRPLVDQRAHDKQAENGRPFRQFLQEAAAHVVDDVHPFTVTVGHAVIAGQQAHQVEQHEEQDRSEQAAAHGDARPKRGEYRPHGAPEDRVTDARQRPHQTNLDAVDCGVVDRCAVGALLFHRHGHAEYRCRHVRVGVEELQVTLDRLFAIVIVFRIQATDHRHHREAKTQRLHAFEVP